MRRPIHELIEEKRRWHTPQDPEAAKKGFRGWHSRGYLPHFDMPGVTQMLNYRLDDAMPVTRRHEWAALLTIDTELERRAKIEDYLDRGFGNCELRDPRAAAIVENNWLHRDGELYRLLAWVVMPNHVHLVVQVWQTHFRTCWNAGKATPPGMSIECSVGGASCGKTTTGTASFAMKHIIAK